MYTCNYLYAYHMYLNHETIIYIDINRLFHVKACITRTKSGIDLARSLVALVDVAGVASAGRDEQGGSYSMLALIAG